MEEKLTIKELIGEAVVESPKLVAEIVKHETHVKPETRVSVMTNESGVLKPQNLDEAYRLCVAYHKSRLLPARYSSPEMILTAMQFALELNLKPLTAMRQIAVIDGTPSLFGDLPLSLVYSSNKLEWIREFYVDAALEKICFENGNMGSNVFGAVCMCKRKNDPEIHETSFTLDEAKSAGLLSRGVWKSYPKRMLRYRARGQALKDKFPDCLNGIAIAEYDFHTIPDENSDAIKTGKAAELETRLGD